MKQNVSYRWLPLLLLAVLACSKSETGRDNAPDNPSDKPKPTDNVAKGDKRESLERDG